MCFGCSLVVQVKTTNHIEGVAYTCGAMLAIRVCTEGEGAKSNVSQIVDTVLLLSKFNEAIPTL